MTATEVFSPIIVSLLPGGFSVAMLFADAHPWLDGFISGVCFSMAVALWVWAIVNVNKLAKGYRA